MKRRLERFSDLTHKQSGEHRLAFAVAVLLVAGTLVGFGAAFLAQSLTPGNPTCLSATQSLNVTWKDSSGNVLPNPAIGVSGTITCTISGTMALVEYANVPVWYGTNTGSPSANIYMATPYYVDSIQTQVYQGNSLITVVDAVPSTANYPQSDKDWVVPRSGGAVSPAWFGQIGSWYSTKRTPFPTGYSPNTVPDPNTGSYWNAEPPISTATWTLSLDTRTLTNGVAYTLWAKVHWNYWDSLSLWSVFRAITPHPPSIVNYGVGGGWVADNGGAMFLSSLVIGEEDTPDVGPSRVTNLAATGVSTGGSATLTWTSPTDESAALAGYIVKYSTSGPIDYLNWNNENWSAIYAQTWVPASQGEPESRAVNGLEPSVAYWFALIAYDTEGVYGSVSNSARTGGGIPSEAFPVIFIVVLVVVTATVLYLKRR